MKITRTVVILLVVCPLTGIDARQAVLKTSIAPGASCIPVAMVPEPASSSHSNSA